MAYCQSAERIINSEGKPSWIKLQIDAHRARCKLCEIISSANEHGGVLPIAMALSLGLSPYTTEGNAWIGAEPQLVVEYEGQQILIQK